MNMGMVSARGSEAYPDTLPTAVQDQHWYVISFQAGGSLPHIYLSSGGTEYVFDVYADCNGGSVGCASLGQVDWTDNPANGCTSVSSPTFYVRVRPLTPNYACASYILTLSD